MLKAANLREMERDELADKERELSRQLFALRLQKVTGQLESPAKVKETKKDLARVLTVLAEKTVSEKKKPAPEDEARALAAS